MDSRTISHAGRYWYFVDNLRVANEREAVVRLWVALPFTRPGQTVSQVTLSPEPSAVYADSLGGNRIAYWEVREFPSDAPLAVTVDFSVVGEEVRTELDPALIEPYDRGSEEYQRYTRSEPWIEITPEIRAAARDAIGQDENPWRAAKRIFDFVVREMSYEFPDVSQRGAAKSFARRKGDCGEYSAVFAALCRAVGIPARIVTCNWFTGYGHQWSEFLCPPYGWIPVDASVSWAMRSGGDALSGRQDMRRFCANRSIPWGDPDWLFGNLYANRLVVFVGTNVQAGNRRFSFMQPAGNMAEPEGFDAENCGDQVVHGGFYLFDESREEPERARDVAKRQLAQAYFDAGVHGPAEEGFRLVVADEPENSLAWFHLGQISMARGELPQAREALTKCMQGSFGSIQPVLSAIGRLLRGNCYDLDGMRQDAVADYEAVLASGIEFQDVPNKARQYLGTPYRGPYVPM